MRESAIILAGLLAVLAAACDTVGDSELALRSEVRDSAGVTIVENARPVTGSRLDWRFGTAPAVSIGTQEGDEGDMLFLVLDATKLPDGRIVLANAGSSELRVFSADGAHLATWGGLGEGPGEFNPYTPETVSQWPGDSIAGDNMFRRQVQVFDAAGDHGRTVTLADGYQSFLGVMPDGTLLVKPSTVLSGGVFGAAETLVRKDQDFGLLLPGGELRVSLGAHPGEEWFSSPAAAMARPHPFGRSTVSAIWGDLAVVAPNDRYELRAYASDGSLTGIIRRDHELRAPTQAELDEWLTEAYADLPEERRTPLFQRLEGMTPVEFFPAFEALESDPLGYLWVQEYPLPGEQDNVWTVFDPGGRVRGFVETPLGLDVFEIGEDYVLGMAADENDVERVQLWPLDRNPG